MHLSMIPPAPISPDQLEALVTRVTVLAEMSEQTGTFGVGGLLCDNNGVIIKEMTNCVVVNGKVCDPTAHVERQLIDWYFSQSRAAEYLVPLHELTIITSLDPCMMCAGAALEVGVNIISVGEDPDAGVHARSDCLTLAPELRGLAKRQFGLFAIEGVRQFSGPAESPFRSFVVNRGLYERCRTALLRSLEHVRTVVGAPLKARISWPEAIKPLNMPRAGELLWGSALKHRKLLARLDKGEGIALLYHMSGRPIVGYATSEVNSPIRTATMELIRRVSKMRHEGDFKSRLLPLPAEAEFRIGDSQLSPALATMSLGAIGSFLEGPVARKGRPVVRTLKAGCDSTLELGRFLEEFPSFYTDYVGIRWAPFSEF